MNILTNARFVHLVGIKGVAMTALAQCLLDANKVVSGSDMPDDFVTKERLDSLPVQVTHGFDHPLPENVDCVIYTAAHQGINNPVVQLAMRQGIPVLSQAEAQAILFNAKKGVAVCGVGGKSSVTAMIVWILEYVCKKQRVPPPSYSIGVGSVPGLERTGRWSENNPYFIAEADEYVADPTAASRGEVVMPKLLLLHPQIVVCTNLHFDHPDVYRDFNHTKEVFARFFSQINDKGFLIYNFDDEPLRQLVESPHSNTYTLIPFSSDHIESGVYFSDYKSIEGLTTATIHTKNQTEQLNLKLPGRFNVMNAVSAIAAVLEMGTSLADACEALASFRSTKRRFEFIGQKRGVSYYDDYAHHPHEIKKTIDALNEWFPNSRKVVVFQPHTFSRTKQLFTEFVDSFEHAEEIVLTDIFASAREQRDPTISSTTLEHALLNAYPGKKVHNLHTNQAVASYLNESCEIGSVVLTIGAGVVYQVHDLIGA